MSACLSPQTYEAVVATSSGPRSIVRERAPVYASDAHSSTGQRVLDAFAGLRRAESRVDAAGARLMAHLFDRGGHEHAGFSSFGDFARERLNISPRAASDMRALDRALSTRPAVRRAFLNGDVTSCQIEVLASSLNDENEAYWLLECRSLTVRQLREKLKKSGGDPPPEENFRTVSFDAPPATAVFWEHAMETARRVVGFEAPAWRCVEAVLAEASSSFPKVAAVAEGTRTDEPKADPAAEGNVNRAAEKRRAQTFATPADPARRATVIPLDRPAVARLNHTLSLIDRELQDIEELIHDAPEADTTLCILRFKALQQVGRPLCLLTGRLLRDMRDAGVLATMGYSRLADFATDVLHVSRNTAHNRLRESELFFAGPELEHAFVSGRIGVGQAVLIHRLAPPAGVDGFLRRSEEITVRQFQREIRLLERLEGFIDAPTPFPVPGLEDHLKSHLVDRGWSQDEIDTTLNNAGLGGDNGDDPARNPHAMRRLETLANWLILTAYEDDTDDACDEACAQTFAAPDSSTVTSDLPRMGGRTMHRERPMSPIRFRAPLQLVVQWKRAISAVGRARRLPTWACVTLLLREAVGEWERANVKPHNWKVLERDGYLCQAPGCSSRRLLEAHHVVFRSRGGDDSKQNLITLCFHHHRMLHESGWISVNGRVPGLTWTVGGRRYHGERRIRRSRQLPRRTQDVIGH